MVRECVNYIKIIKKDVILFCVLVLILVLPNSTRHMEEKRNNRHLQEWQLFKLPVPDPDFYKDQERGEEDENGFYSFTVKEYLETLNLKSD
jgi:hypothetical protein